VYLKEIGSENVDWIHTSVQGQVTSSWEYGTKAVPLNLCVCVCVCGRGDFLTVWGPAGLRRRTRCTKDTPHKLRQKAT